MKDILVKDIIKICNGKLICGKEDTVCENFCRDSRIVSEMGEAHRSAADCWPSGRGPSSPGLWRAGGVSAPIDVNRVWVRRWRGPPLASFQAETLDGVPWSEWAFPGHSCAPDRQDPRWGGWAVRGLWFVALPRSGWWDQPRVDQSGALSSAKGTHRPRNAP